MFPPSWSWFSPSSLDSEFFIHFNEFQYMSIGDLLYPNLTRPGEYVSNFHVISVPHFGCICLPVERCMPPRYPGWKVYATKVSRLTSWTYTFLKLHGSPGPWLRGTYCRYWDIIIFDLILWCQIWHIIIFDMISEYHE